MKSVHSQRLWLRICVLLPVLMLSIVSAAGGVRGAANGATNGATTLMDHAEAAFPAKRDISDGRDVIALYERVLEADPDHLEATVRLAELHWWMGELVAEGEALPLLQTGLEYAQAAIVLDDDSAEAHYWSGVLQGRIGEERGILQSLFMVDDVVAEAQRALELDPQHGGAHFLLSQVYRKAPGWPLSVGDDEKALEHALEAARLEGDETSRWLNVAQCYLAVGRDDKARETLEKVLDMPLTPGDETISRMDKARAKELLAELNG